MSARHKGLALTVLAFSQLMIVLDSTIVNVALPAVSQALEFSRADLQWIVNSYTLAFGGFLLLGGRLADRFGRRNFFMIGLAIFAIASGLGGLAQSQEVLIAARALQGFGGALMAPAALSLLTVIFSEGEERNKALGVWGGIAAGGAAIGLLLGGVLVQYLDWRWIFFVNIPITVLVLIGTMKFVPESNEQHVNGFDVGGAITVTGGLVALVYGLVRGNELGWTSTETLLTFAVAVVMLTVFVLLQRHGRNPLVPFRIFERRNVVGADLAVLMVGAGMFGMFFYVSIFLQDILGFSAIKTGFAFLPVSLVIMASAGVASALLTKVGPRRLAVPGMIVAGTGMLLLTRIHPGGSYLSDVLIPLMVMASGMGMTFVSLTAAAVAGVPERDSGLASALLNTGQQIGGALGLAMLTAVSEARMDAVSEIVGQPTAADVTSGYTVGFIFCGLLLYTGAAIAAYTIKLTREETEAAAKAAVAAG
jgi:EmrB/QacA subfamily drug resistance transporter